MNEQKPIHITSYHPDGDFILGIIPKYDQSLIDLLKAPCLDSRIELVVLPTYLKKDDGEIEILSFTISAKKVRGEQSK